MGYDTNNGEKLAAVKEASPAKTETPAAGAAGEKRVKKNTLKQLAAAFSFGALCVGTICAVGIMGLDADQDQTPVKAAVAQTAAAVGGEAPAVTSAEAEACAEPAEEDVIVTVSWWKAGVEEYDFIDIDDSIATTTTTAAPTVTTTTAASASAAEKKTAAVTTAPKKTTTKAKTTTAAKTTAAKKTTTTAKTTAESGSAEEGKWVVSCTDEEFEMFCYVLEGEAGGCSEAAKMAVAGVIVNRVQCKNKFDNTIKGVLTAKSQFTAISKYYNRSVTPSASTINCVKRALAGEDGSNGAYYFYSPKYASSRSAAWFESLTFCIEIDGQRFFKN